MLRVGLGSGRAQVGPGSGRDQVGWHVARVGVGSAGVGRGPKTPVWPAPGTENPDEGYSIGYKIPSSKVGSPAVVAAQPRKQ